jgi:hypothetical protein
VPFNLSGTFVATLQAEVPRNATGSGLGQRLHDAIRTP